MRYEIGSRIRKYREEHGLSQTQLVEMLNVSNSRVSNWEQGINRPDADILADICRALRVSPSELLDVHLSEDDFTDSERKLIKAYRCKTDMQKAVNILLGLNESNQ